VLVELAREDRGILRQLDARFELEAPPQELVAATRQAIADATDFDERDANRNFAYDYGGRGLENDGIFGLADDRSDGLFGVRARFGRMRPQHSSRKYSAESSRWRQGWASRLWSSAAVGRPRSAGNARLGPPPALRSTAAVLAAARGQGVDRMLRGGRLSAKRLAERGARDEPCEAKGRQPGQAGAELAPQAVRVPADVRYRYSARL